jgi:sugar phosphate isomerase/epimerase
MDKATVGANRITWTVFTKPWKLPLEQLGDRVARLGFDGIELPVRPGYQVVPERVSTDLPVASRSLASRGVRIVSVAGPTDEATIAACAEAGVPVLRVMARLDGSYTEAEADVRREYEAIVPLLDRYGVTLGIQNHVGRFVTNALGLMRLIEPIHSPRVALVWDAAHEALAGGEPEHALDVVWPRLAMVNLKNAYWQRTTGPEAEVADWRHYWTTGRHGLASWPRVAAELRRRAYSGVICLTAEYSDAESVDRLISADLSYARSLFE